jgi:D-amino-acid dehydrogenase
MKSKHIVIVGGGVIGLCTAYYALDKGHRVTVLECGTADHDSCSLGNAGMIVPSHFIPLAAPGMVEMGLRMMRNPESPFYVRPLLNSELVKWGWQFMRAANKSHVKNASPLLLDLNRASRAAYEDLSARFDDSFELVKRGLLMLCKTERALHEEEHVVKAANRLGMDAYVVDAAGAAKIDPGVRMDIAGAVYFPEDAHLSPHKLTARLKQGIIESGGEILYESGVDNWHIENGRVKSVQTASDSISADEFVLAAGSWSPSLVRELNIALPMQAGKGYSVTLPQPRQKPELCSILTEARVAVTPMGDTLRIGGTMEINGMDETISPARVRGILQAVPQYFPEFSAADFETPDGKPLPVWKGLRPCSPDGLPYVGRFERYANLSAATGHAMMGVSLGPVTGKLMASILSDEKPFVDIAMLRPDRYK